MLTTGVWDAVYQPSNELETLFGESGVVYPVENYTQSSRVLVFWSAFELGRQCRGWNREDDSVPCRIELYYRILQALGCSTVCSAVAVLTLKQNMEILSVTVLGKMTG